MIRTLALILFFALSIILGLPLLILWTVIVGSADLMYGLSMKVVRLGNLVVGVRVHLEGLENIPPGPCLFIANHVSYVDALAFIPAIPRRVTVLIKKELFRIPILGFGMRRAKFVPVDRGKRATAYSSIEASVAALKQGLSIAVFAEGTRSPDGRLRPFKRGAFNMAIEAEAPIIPVSISGTLPLMKKGSWIVRPGEVNVRFGPPVDASAYSIDRRADLQERVEALVAAGLPPEQRPLSRHTQSSPQ
jgi:1-acyl-sn-glycerol-3-phosphate acyltransferase